MKIFFISILIVFILATAGFVQGQRFSNDSHVHITNYVQEGPDLAQFLTIMNKYRIKRCAIFGIPLQLEWNMDIEKHRPTYYLNTDGRLYYYSAVDPVIARKYLSLSPEDQKRFDPMICGFNPTDGNAVEHIKKMIALYPGVFCGIGEFSIYKEAVSSRTYGKSSTLNDKAMDKILNLAGEIGLVVNIHCDIDAMAKDKNIDNYPRYFDDMYSLLKRHTKTTVIWAHTGLGRYVSPSDYHIKCLTKMINNCPNAYFDISWSEVAKYIIENDNDLKQWAELLCEYPGRFLFGTDSVAPSEEKYENDVHMYDKLWEILPVDVQEKIKFSNHNRIFDKANRKTKEWEKKNLKVLVPIINWPFEN